MKKSVCVYLGQELANYHFGEEHPFGPKRHDAFRDEFLRLGLDDNVEIHPPVSCTEIDISLFHTTEYVEQVKEKSRLGVGALDYGDTPAIQGIFETTLYVVGSVIDLVNKIMSEEIRCGFVPIAGLHHARRDRAAGFCVFNDCAIAIEYLKQHYGLKRIAYVDIDAHHGDGVYYGFESDQSVIIADIHESADYLYPGTGRDDESGIGDAQGTKLNINLPPGSNDEDFSRVWPSTLNFIRDFNPEFIVLQCGADSMEGDPITHMSLSEKSHYRATSDLCKLANETCNGRVIACGGGGYNLSNIAKGWSAVVRALIESGAEV